MIIYTCLRAKFSTHFFFFTESKKIVLYQLHNILGAMRCEMVAMQTVATVYFMVLYYNQHEKTDKNYQQSTVCGMHILKCLWHFLTEMEYTLVMHCLLHLPIQLHPLLQPQWHALQLSPMVFSRVVWPQ